jgi:general stress protein 26
MSAAPAAGPSPMTVGEIDPRYGDAAATAPAWAQVEGLLSNAQLYWIVTVRADGRPHAVPLVGIWHDGAFAFCTGAQEQKVRNLDAHPQVAVATGTTGAGGWDSGKEVVVEGTAERITDPAALQVLADAWYAKYGDDWHFAVRGDEFVELSHSGDGTGGARVFRVAPAKVLVFGGEHGQTRFRPATTG